MIKAAYKFRYTDASTPYRYTGVEDTPRIVEKGASTLFQLPCVAGQKEASVRHRIHGNGLLGQPIEPETPRRRSAAVEPECELIDVVVVDPGDGATACFSALTPGFLCQVDTRVKWIAPR